MRGARRWWAIESETFKTLEYGEICAVSSATSGTATTICATCSDCSPCWPCQSSGPAEPPRDVQKAPRQNLYLRDGPRVLVRRFAFPGRETLYRDLAGELGSEDHIELIPATDRGRGGAPRASTAPIQRQPSPNLEKPHRARSPGHCPCAPETLKPRKAAKKFIGGNYCISTDQLVTGYLLNVTGK